MPKIYRCPKCDARYDPPLDAASACPGCGIWFQKWLRQEGFGGGPAEAPAGVFVPAPDAEVGAATFYGRLAAFVLLALWSFRLAGYDYRVAEINASFMHAILLPIHEAGHVFLMPFGEFMTVLGGSLFQLALPLGIGAAFLLRQNDRFGAALCVWWAGASLVDLSPYIWDALNPQMDLLGGRTGEDGPHDWIYLLERFGLLHRAHGLGATAHHLGVLVMFGGLAWCAPWLLRHWKALRGRDAPSRAD